MNDRQLRDLLDSAADPVGEVDLVESAWHRGRSSRTRQRLTWAGVGGALVAAAVLALGQGWTGEVVPAKDSNQDDVATTTAPGSLKADPPASGEVVSLTFTKDPGAEEGGALVSPGSDPAPIRGSTWRLTRLFSSRDGELPGALGAELRFDGTTWSVTACGVQTRAEGRLATGRIRITGTWQSTEGQSFADCPTDALTAQQWQSLLNSAPEVGVNETTLVLHAWGGPDPTQQDNDTAIIFAPSTVSQPVFGQPTELPDAAILEQGWREVGAEEAADLFDPLPWVDIAPDQTMTLSAASGTLSVTTCETWSIEHTWVNDFQSVNNGVAGLLVATGDATPSQPRCPGAAGKEGEALETILRTHPQLYLFGDYLVIRGYAPDELLEAGTTDSPATTP